MADAAVADIPALLPIRVRGLRHEIGGQLRLDIPSMEIADGGPSIILGPNGAGKSLLLRVLHGLVAPTAADVTFAGQPATKEIRLAQAMVFQKPVLLRRTLAANIGYALASRRVPRSRRGAEIERYLGIANLADRPHQPARSLSGGEQQRLALVRALALRPRVLFLDEPTASLDPGATQDIEQIVTGAARGGTKVIMVTHDLGQAQRMAEEVIFLHRGRVAEQSRAEQFFARPASEVARRFISGKLVL